MNYMRKSTIALIPGLSTTPISAISGTKIEADGGCRINNFEAPRSAPSNSNY
jgi:hypothetical protein